tara:strand:+ start:544 stop:1323 length:780 start_codon:yes stop_codon:yes gene_type:complete
MADFRPVLAKDFDPSKVNFTNSRVMGSGAKLFFLEYNGGPLVIQSPDMPVTFDPQVFEEGPDAKYSVKTSLNMSNEQCKEFYEKMSQFDDRLKQLGKENSQEWFKKKNMSDEVVDSMYTQCVKEHIDQETGEPSGRYPPSFSFKVKKKEGNILCRCFDENREELNFNNPDADNHVMVADVLKKNSSIKGLFKCDFIWHSPGKFGCTWSAQQLKVKVAKSFSDGYAFMDDDEEGKDDERISQAQIIESDEEDEEELVEAA